MVHIDKNDALYNYLTKLGVEDADKTYLELANNGRYKLKDVRQYFMEKFMPSQVEDIDEKELIKVLDYYVDLKKVKQISSNKLKQLLLEYKQTGDEKLKSLIINSQLKDVLYMCLNYKTLHKDTDVQDLVQISNIGLLNALNKYDENAKLDFKDYVIYWVREEILKEFEEKNNG